MSHIHPEIRRRARELRQQQTPAEQTLWRCLRNEQINGLKFRRQHPIGSYIVDFYCAACKLVIEVDGGGHFEAEQIAYDEERTRFLNACGYGVIRFTNQEVKEQLNAVIESILENCKVYG